MRILPLSVLARRMAASITLSLAVTVFAPAAFAVCGAIPVDYPVYAAYRLSTGSNNLVSNGTVTSPVDDVGNFPLGGIRPNDGHVESAALSLPTIEPPFPSFSSTADRLVPPNIPPGTYRTVTADNAATFGGDYFMSRLDIRGGNPQNITVVTLNSGDYYLDVLSVGNNVRVIINGPVRIFVRTSLSLGNNNTWNESGSLANLQILLYPGAQASFGENNVFRGLIYGDRAKIQIGNNNVFTGAVLTSGAAEGEISIGNNNLFNFDPATRLVVGSITTCPAVARFLINIGSGAASTCVPFSIAITALDSRGQVITGYTGTINLTTSTGRGDWSRVAANGTLTNGAAGDGAASYAFVAADAGAITLALDHPVASDVVVTVVDSARPTSLTDSGTVRYRDNAVVVSEDESAAYAAANAAGTVVAGRPHRMKAELWTRSPAGLCAILGFTRNGVGARLWLSPDTLHVAGATLPGASTSSSCAGQVALGTAVPGATTLGLDFAAGVARFYLCPSDVGKYGLNARVADASLPSVQDGTTPMLTARPFALTVSDIRSGANTNSKGAQVTDPVFIAAGREFSAVVGAYAWSAAADARDAAGAAVADGRGDGLPDAVATLVQTTAGGLLTRFGSTARLAASLNTPAGGVAGQLRLGGAAADVALSAGTATPANLSYSEVGSFRLVGAGAGGAAVNNYLGGVGANLAPTVFEAAGAQSAVVGRFVPAEFRVSAATVVNRSDLAGCAGSAFTYLGEPMRVQFTLSAHSAATGAPVTANYTGAFARLSPLDGARLAFGAADGAVSLTGGLTVTCAAAACGTWASGTATVLADLAVARSVLNACTGSEKPAGPYESAVLGISPVDADGVAMQAPFDFDRNGDATLDGRQIAMTRLRFGRLQISAAYGTDYLDLPIPLEAQYWNGFAFVRNTLDNCTSLQAPNVNLRNYSPAGFSAQVPHANVAAGGVFSGGRGTLTLRKPLTRTGGSLTVCADLDSGAGGDTSCQAGTPAATTYLQARGACGVYDRDPSARAAFGLHKSPDSFIHFRESF